MHLLNRTTPCGAGVLIVVLGAILTVQKHAGADDWVTVTIDDGRQLHAEVDVATNDRALWLRFGSGSTLVRRRIPWHRLIDATQEQQPLERGQLLALARKTATDANTDPVATKRRTSEFDATDAERAQIMLGLVPRVVDVEVDAFPANTKDRGEGIYIRICPIDAAGNIVAVDGQIDIDLFASRDEAVRRAVRFQLEQFDDTGLTLVVDRSAVNALDGGSIHDIELRIRVSLPGHGVFDLQPDA